MFLIGSYERASIGPRDISLRPTVDDVISINLHDSMRGDGEPRYRTPEGKRKGQG